MSQVDALRFFGSLSEQDAVAQLAQVKAMRAAEAPPATLEEGARTGEAAPERDVSHAEAMAEAVDELRASAEALDGLLEAATGEQRDILRSVLESLREARGYLTGQEVEAERELPGEVESESSEDT
jgi:hypothetical protein